MLYIILTPALERQFVSEEDLLALDPKTVYGVVGTTDHTTETMLTFKPALAAAIDNMSIDYQVTFDTTVGTDATAPDYRFAYPVALSPIYHRALKAVTGSLPDGCKWVVALRSAVAARSAIHCKSASVPLTHVVLDADKFYVHQGTYDQWIISSGRALLEAGMVVMANNVAAREIGVHDTLAAALVDFHQLRDNR